MCVRQKTGLCSSHCSFWHSADASIAPLTQPSVGAVFSAYGMANMSAASTASPELQAQVLQLKELEQSLRRAAAAREAELQDALRAATAEADALKKRVSADVGVSDAHQQALADVQSQVASRDAELEALRREHSAQLDAIKQMPHDQQALTDLQSQIASRDAELEELRREHSAQLETLKQMPREPVSGSLVPSSEGEQDVLTQLRDATEMHNAYK
jgi:hypothetical protein